MIPLCCYKIPIKHNKNKTFHHCSLVASRARALLTKGRIINLNIISYSKGYKLYETTNKVIITIFIISIIYKQI